MPKYIASIVTKMKITFDPLIKRCDNISLIEKGLPVLLIGWENVKKVFPSQSILNKQINDNMFWTFSKNEKRVDYEKDINSFYVFIIKNILNNITYINCDVLTFDIKKVKGLINFLNSTINKIVYIDNNSFMFILYENEHVMGLSLDKIEYLGFSKDKIIKKIESNKYNVVFTNTGFLSLRMRRIIDIDKVIIPHLYSTYYQ